MGVNFKAQEPLRVDRVRLDASAEDTRVAVYSPTLSKPGEYLCCPRTGEILRVLARPELSTGQLDLEVERGVDDTIPAALVATDPLCLVEETE